MARVKGVPLQGTQEEKATYGSRNLKGQLKL